VLSSKNLAFQAGLIFRKFSKFFSILAARKAHGTLICSKFSKNLISKSSIFHFFQKGDLLQVQNVLRPASC
jgi:hypothetical protein